jgi:hypothetical protein
MKKYILFTVFIFSLLVKSFSQGCSDAGFCTMGAMKPNQGFQKQVALRLRSFEISQYLGITKFDDYIWATTADFNFSITPKMMAQVKVPFMYIQGPLGTTQGIGDISWSFTYNVLAKENQQINITLGGKLPSGNPDIKNPEGLVLPMYYQTTLGTYDLVLGASWINRSWLVAVGYQQPFNQVQNEFFWGLWANHKYKAIANEYPVSRDLYRGADLMIRVEKNFRFARWSSFIGILPIYRITKDINLRKNDVTGVLERQYIENSNGFATSLLVGGSYYVDRKTTLKMLLGRKLASRQLNPDGLSREYVATIGCEMRF